MVIGPRNSDSMAFKYKSLALTCKNPVTVRRNASKNKEVLQLLFAECCSLVKYLKIYFFFTRNDKNCCTTHYYVRFVAVIMLGVLIDIII